MSRPKFFPLVDMDSTGTEKVPMFAARNERECREKYGAYLEKTAPGCYREHKLRDLPVRDNVRCPYCGERMECVSRIDAHNLYSVYRCNRCQR